MFLNSYLPVAQFLDRLPCKHKLGFKSQLHQDFSRAKVSDGKSIRWQEYQMEVHKLKRVREALEVEVEGGFLLLHHSSIAAHSPLFNWHVA